MVSELHARKTALEAKLVDKNRELKLLCIQEAELTGILPPEIPLQPGESPPIFRRRIGTSFVFPENLINTSKPKFKEDDSVAALELERQIQMGIADAALSLANDGSATKSVRRKHRSLYQQSQGRLLELESRLNTLRQPRNISKQRKKPRPPLENEDADCDAAGLLHEGGVSLSPPPVNHSGQISWEPQHHEPLIRHSSTHDGLAFRSSRHNQALPPSAHPHLQRYGSGGPYYYGGVMISHQYSTLSSCAHSELDRCRGRLEQGASTPGYWLRYEDTDNAWSSTGPRPVPRSAYSVRQPPQEQASRGPDRFTGSLDRRKLPAALHSGSSPCLESWNGPVETEVQHSIIEETSRTSVLLPVHHQTNLIAPSAEALLPGQTYPEHGLGLVRTQSLGSVEAAKKNKEKEWYETSLDAAPNPPLRQARVDVSSDVGSNLSRSSSNVSNERRPLHARSREIPAHENFETVVPYESPKNHTVVQAGKWQPYREVTKPFEMADFYKYSTKFRKNETTKQAPTKQPKNFPGRPPNLPIARQSPPVHGSAPVAEPSTSTVEPEDVTPQQKGVYQPLKPMTCNPVDPNLKSPEEGAGASLDGALSSEMLAWYQDQSLPRSATLV